MIVIAIIGLVVSLLLPAVQAARDSARTVQCASNLRQVAFCSLSQTDFVNHLPESRISIGDDGRVNRELLWGRFHAEITHRWNYDFPFSTMLQNSVNSSPAYLKCPSAPQSTLLTHLPNRLEDTSAFSAEIETCDYRGNRGVLDRTIENRTGVYSVFRDHTPPRALSSVEDGHSQTVYAWETIGACSVSFSPRTGRIKMKPWDSTTLYRYIMFDGPYSANFQGNNGQQYTGYFHGWIGFSAGFITVNRIAPSEPGGNFDNRYLDTNDNGDPFSFHPGGINLSFGDGHVQSINHKVNLEVLMQLADCQDGMPKVAAQDN